MVTPLLLMPLKKNTFLWIMGGLFLIFMDIAPHAFYTNRNFPENVPANEVRLGYLSVFSLLIAATWTSSPVSHWLITTSAIKAALLHRHLCWRLGCGLLWVLWLEFGLCVCAHACLAPFPWERFKVNAVNFWKVSAVCRFHSGEFSKWPSLLVVDQFTLWYHTCANLPW